MAARPRTGVNISDLRMPGREAILQAARLGFGVIQIDTVGTEFEPRQFGETARRHLRRFVGEQNMEIAALAVDIGGNRMGEDHRLDEGVDRTRQALQMAAQMNVPIVALEPGIIVPDDAQVVEAMRRIAQEADRAGCFVALQTGYSDPQQLATLLGEVGAPSLRVCYDPAGLLLGGYEALSGIEPLADQVILAYVRDAIGGYGGSPLGNRAPVGREASLGEGHIDLTEYVAALHEAGYHGPLIVRRLHSLDPVAELGAARERVEALGR